MRHIVLTGGPCAGKTRALAALEGAYPNDLYVVAEASAVLIEGGFPRPGRGVETWSSEWQRDFEHATLAVHQAIDRIADREAERLGRSIQIHDRTALDGAGFVEESVEEFCHEYGLDLEKELARFIAVIHLESLATYDKVRYRENVGTERVERDIEMARVWEMKLREVWAQHPRRVIVPAQNDLEEKIEKVVTLVGEILEEQIPQQRLPIP